ncbi:hypothetical protein PMAYCL1PPCAC_21233, partial [Pristionchus mayeri]
DSQMDIFLLPDLALRRVIKLMENRNRLRLRRTCRSLEFFSTPPDRKYILDVISPLESGMLVSLPPMEKLILHDQVPVAIFLDLMLVHRSLYVLSDTISLSIEECIAVMKIFSEDSRERDIRFSIDSTTFRRYLTDFGMTDTTQAGDRFGEFDLIGLPDGVLASSILQLLASSTFSALTGRTELDLS